MTHTGLEKSQRLRGLLSKVSSSRRDEICPFYSDHYGVNVGIIKEGSLLVSFVSFIDEGWIYTLQQNFYTPSSQILLVKFYIHHKLNLVIIKVELKGF